MHGLRRSLTLIMIAGLAPAWPLPATRAGATRLPENRPGGSFARGIWTVVPSRNLGQDVNDLAGVSALADDDVWAVGFYRNASLVYQTMAQHFDGTSWRVIPTPNSGPDWNFLVGVSALAASDVWAVGRWFDGSSLRTLAEHWDGTTWTIYPTPNGMEQNSALTAVDVIASNDAWAVGYTNTLSQYEPIAMHWDGSVWEMASVPGPGLFHAVAGIASNDAWAVGQTALEGVTLTQHWDGSAWSVVPSPNGSGDNALTGVSAVASNDVWAVGDQSEGTRTLAEHWSGHRWRIVPTPDPLVPADGNSVLVAVTTLTSDDAWAVGFTIDFLQGGLEQTMTQHWDGNAWAVVASPNPGSGSCRLVGTSSLEDGTVWAVGARHVRSTPYDHTLTIRTVPG